MYSLPASAVLILYILNCFVVVCDQEGCKEQVDVSLGWNWRPVPKKADFLLTCILHSFLALFMKHVSTVITPVNKLGVIFLIKLRNDSK